MRKRILALLAVALALGAHASSGPQPSALSSAVSDSLSVLEIEAHNEDAGATTATRRRRRALKAKATRRRRRSSRRRRKTQTGKAVAKTGGAESFKWPLGAPPKWQDELGARCGLDERHIQSLERKFAECDTEIARSVVAIRNGKEISKQAFESAFAVLQFFAKLFGLNTRLLPSRACCDTLISERNRIRHEKCIKAKIKDHGITEKEADSKCIGNPAGFHLLKWNKKAVEQCCGKCPHSKCDLDDKDGTCVKLEKFKNKGLGWDGWDTRCPARTEGDAATRRLGDSHQLTEEFIFDTIKSVASKAVSFVKKKAGSLGKGAIAAAKKMAINLAMKLAPAEYRRLIQAAAPYLLKGDMKGMMKAVLKVLSGGLAKELIAYPVMRMFDPNSIGLDLECPIAAYLHPVVSSDFHIHVDWLHRRGSEETSDPTYIPNPGTSNVGCGGHHSSYGPLKLRMRRMMLSSHPDFEATKRKRPKDMDPILSAGCKVGSAAEGGLDCIEMCSFDFDADLHRCMPKTPEGGWKKGVDPAGQARCDKVGMTFPRTTASSYDETKNKCTADEEECDNCKKWYLSTQAIVQTLLGFGLSQNTNAFNVECFTSGVRKCDV